MARFENKYNIKTIKMYKKIHNLCTIGQDWFTNDIEIVFTPDKIIPDYIEVDNAIQELEAKELVIEEVVNNILEMLKEYQPKYISVKSKVNDAMHLPVEVEAEYKN